MLVAQDSDEKWDQARSLTAQAQEQSRIAQTKSASASATERESNEAMRRADVARGQIQDIEVLSCLSAKHAWPFIIDIGARYCSRTVMWPMPPHYSSVRAGCVIFLAQTNMCCDVDSAI